MNGELMRSHSVVRMLAIIIVAALLLFQVASTLAAARDGPEEPMAGHSGGQCPAAALCATSSHCLTPCSALPDDEPSAPLIRAPLSVIHQGTPAFSDVVNAADKPPPRA